MEISGKVLQIELHVQRTSEKGKQNLRYFQMELVDQLCDEHAVINSIIKLENWGFLDYKKFNNEIFFKILVNFMTTLPCILDTTEINN